MPTSSDSPDDSKSRVATWRDRIDQSGLQLGVALLCFAALCAMLLGREIVFFRDFAIVWDGAWRLTQGLSPFSEFGSPVGPVVLFIPALFFEGFGATWAVFQSSQMAQNALLLGLAWLILRRVGARGGESIAGVGTFSFLYLIFLTHPWYNTTAILCFMLAIWVALQGSRLAMPIAGLLCASCIFAKQDYGVLCVFSVLGLRFFTEFDPSGRPRVVYPRRFCEILPRLWAAGWLGFGLCLALGVAGYVALYDTEHFLYWFNYGQPPHEVRKPPLKETLRVSLFLLSVLCFVFALRRRDMALLVAAVFFFVANITRSTSGLGHTAWFYVFWAPLLINRIVQRHFFGHILAVLVLLVMAGKILKPPVIHAFHVYRGLISDRFEPYFFDSLKVRGPLIPLGDCAPAFSSSYGPASVCEAISKVRSQLPPSLPGVPRIFLNMSELTPLYAVFESQPPEGLPLWFHSRVSFFPPEQARVEQGIRESRYDLIALQAAHETWGPIYQRILVTLENNPDYREIGEGFDTPAGALAPCKPSYACNSRVRFFLRRAAGS
jgi:hypothetical protein